ncbi:SGNH/GDSL hydrolase family protein [Patescibacteria group bacterium]|nr:MAG: SGNH/GDSL hydrolase family protein [Patescibacteria group bacterium]
MKTICIFGDSITWGRGLESRVGWANLLRNELEAQDDSIHVYDLGIDGNTTHDLLERVPGEAKVRKPDIIIWAIGVNDSAYRKTPNYPLIKAEQFEDNLDTLFELGAEMAQKQLCVGIAKGSDANTTPLPGSTTGKCYVKQRVREYDEIIKSVAMDTGIEYVSISSVLSDNDFYDGLHPNEKGHKKIFERVLPAVEELL